MKIFYASALGSSNASLATIAIEKVPQLLTQLGHDVTTNFYNPESDGGEDNFDVLAQGIVSADIFIGEMSRPSQTLGFQLAYALYNTKTCLYTYHISTNAKPGPSLTNNPSRLLKIIPYDDLSIKSVLQKFLTYAEGQLNSTRTSFMSTKRIDDFLTNKAKAFGTTKAEIIRQILDSAIDEK